MAESYSKIDIAASEASAYAAARIIAEKLAEEPVSVLADESIVDTAAAKPIVSKKAVGAVSKPARKPAKSPKIERQASAAPEAPTIATAATVSQPTVKNTNTIKHLKDKIMENTTTAAADFTAKAQETAADMQGRMKTAFDKGTEMTADMTAFHKGNFDAVVEAGKVLAAGMQDLGRTAVEDAKLSAETVTADVKAMVAIKSPTELFELQGEIARRNLDTIVARTSKNTEVMMKLVSDMFAPLSSRASVAMERLNKAA